MPYEIEKVPGGFKVRKKDGEKMGNGRMYASDKPLTLETAKRQLAALYASENLEKRYKIFKFDKGYKVGRRDGKKLENGRTFTGNKFLTRGQAMDKIKELIKKQRNQIK